jgi:hypothetical protein
MDKPNLSNEFKRAALLPISYAHAQEKKEFINVAARSDLGR